MDVWRFISQGLLFRLWNYHKWLKVLRVSRHRAQWRWSLELRGLCGEALYSWRQECAMPKPDDCYDDYYEAFSPFISYNMSDTCHHARCNKESHFRAALGLALCKSTAPRFPRLTALF